MRMPLAVALTGALLVSCGGEEPTVELPAGPDVAGGPMLSSEPLADGTFPVEFTCDGDDVSPPLSWSGVSADAVELILSLTDPDAGERPFVHWVVYGIEPKDASFEAGDVPPGGIEGVNDFGRRGYGGPCPPKGQTHEYVFTLTESTQPTGLGPGASLEEVYEALGGPGPQRSFQLGATYGR